MLKTKISAKTKSLEIPNNVCTRSQKGHRILVKLSKNPPYFGPKLGLNYLLGPHHRVIRNSHIAYNRTIYLYFLDSKFQLLGICRSRPYSEEITTFFGSGPNLAHFWGFFGTITPVNKVKLS